MVNQDLRIKPYSFIKTIDFLNRLFSSKESFSLFLAKKKFLPYRFNNSIYRACYKKYSYGTSLTESSNNILYKYIVIDELSSAKKKIFSYNFGFFKNNMNLSNNEQIAQYWFRNFPRNFPKNFHYNNKKTNIINKNNNFFYKFNYFNYYNQKINSNSLTSKVYSYFKSLNTSFYFKNNKYLQNIEFSNKTKLFYNSNVFAVNTVPNIYNKFIIESLEKNYNPSIVKSYLRISNILNKKLAFKFNISNKISAISVKEKNYDFQFTYISYTKAIIKNSWLFKLFKDTWLYKLFETKWINLTTVNPAVFKLWLRINYETYCSEFRHSKELKYDSYKKKFYVYYTELYMGEKPLIIRTRKYTTCTDHMNNMISKWVRVSTNGDKGSKNGGFGGSSSSSSNGSSTPTYYSSEKNLYNIYTFSDKVYEFVYFFEKNLQFFFIKNVTLSKSQSYYNYLSVNSISSNSHTNVNFNNINSILFTSNVNLIKFSVMFDLVVNFAIIILFLYTFFSIFNAYYESVFSFSLKIKNEIVNNDSNIVDFKDAMFLSILFFFNFVLLYNYINNKFIIDFFFISFLYLNIMSLLSYFLLYDINIFVFIQGLFLRINILFYLFKDSLTLFAFCVRLLLQFVRLIFCFLIVFIFQNLVEHFNSILKLVYYYNKSDSNVSEFTFFLKLVIEFLDSIINFVIQMTNYVVFSLWLIPYLFTFIKKKLKTNNKNKLGVSLMVKQLISNQPL